MKINGNEVVCFQYGDPQPIYFITKVGTTVVLTKNTLMDMIRLLEFSMELKKKHYHIQNPKIAQKQAKIDAKQHDHIKEEFGNFLMEIDESKKESGPREDYLLSFPNYLREVELRRARREAFDNED